MQDTDTQFLEVFTEQLEELLRIAERAKEPVRAIESAEKMRYEADSRAFRAEDELRSVKGTVAHLSGLVDSARLEKAGALAELTKTRSLLYPDLWTKEQRELFTSGLPSLEAAFAKLRGSIKQ